MKKPTKQQIEEKAVEMCNAYWQGTKWCAEYIREGNENGASVWAKYVENREGILKGLAYCHRSTVIEAIRKAGIMVPTSLELGDC